MIAEIRQLIETCPLLDNGKINVNYLGIEDLSYSIDTVPSDPIIKRYTDGGEVRQQLFIFASRNFYAKNINNNTKATEFYEKFSKWFEELNNAGNIPIDLGDGCRPLSIEALTGGYLSDNDATTARYQMQCKLTYYKER